MAATQRKIGVLTFHRCVNYGSYWQARCLVEGLRDAGHDAVLLDHRDCGVVAAEYRCALHPTLPARTASGDLPAYKAKTRALTYAADRLPLSAPFALDAPALPADYDAIVIGSDEIWNFRHPWYAARPLFFGAGIDAPLLVSYAASAGNHDAADGFAPEWGTLLRRFTALSVRDANTRRLVADTIGHAPPLVLDPCLQFPAAICAPAPPPDAPDRYVLVYGHGFPDALARRVRGWSRRHGVPLVSVGYRNDWADVQDIAAGPERFAGWMAGAAAVVTNFFHGCVFALVNGAPLLAAPSPYRMTKIRDLAATLDATAHVVAADADDDMCATRLTTPPDARVAARIAAMRAQSAAFVAHALG